MKKIFCDFCGREIEYGTANDWFKILIKSADGIPDSIVAEQCCRRGDICYDCAKKLAEIIRSFQKGQRRSKLFSTYVFAHSRLGRLFDKMEG